MKLGRLFLLAIYDEGFNVLSVTSFRKRSFSECLHTVGISPFVCIRAQCFEFFCGSDTVFSVTQLKFNFFNLIIILL
jgi:hypothetical protein